MLKRFIGVAAVLVLLPVSAFAAFLALLWIFSEKLGNLTLAVYDDHQRTKVAAAHEENLSANARSIPHLSGL